MAVRIPVNLATEPFRRDRTLIVGFALLSALLLAGLVLQGIVIWSERGDAAAAHIVLDRLNAQMTAVDREQARLDATLRMPQNAAVLEQSLFLNQLIQHKAISWTKLFSDLEKVMPPDVRLVTVRLPQVDSHSQVWLDMVVAAKESGPVLELLKRLEKAPQFGATSVLNSLPPSQTEPYVRYRVSVSYAQKL
jgi:Tfp pilus assembly protein PilN